MSESKFKTLRHIEAVRNFLNLIIKELMNRQEQHDQSKLQSPEVEYFEEYTPLLKGLTYGSKEYKDIMKEMKPAIEHHTRNNLHHPEHFYDLVECDCGVRYSDLNVTFCNTCNSPINDINRKYIKRGINAMTLIDLVEMFCDWKAAGLRHEDGNIYRSLEINKERFGIGDQLTQILKNTADFINAGAVFHKADES